MARPDRPKRPRTVTRLQVLRTERLTPHMVRVVAGGPGFAGFTTNEFTDRYVKLLFFRPGVVYPEPLDMAEVKSTMPREDWPVTRTYTVRYVDPVAAEIAIDFVVHGDTGLAAPWALTARPGDELAFFGPGGAYAPDPDADWHLLAGDEAALPAIAAAVEALPDDAQAHVVLQVADAAEEQPLITKAALTVEWLHRGTMSYPEATHDLVRAVKAVPWRPGTAQVFVHGEAGLVKGLRGYLVGERGLDPSLSLSGYWRAGLVEDDFQAWKATEREREAAAQAAADPEAGTP